MITPEQRAALAAPFTNVSWRVARKMKGNDKRGEVVCYIDARDVMDRLDAVFGMDGWSSDIEPLTRGKDAAGKEIILAAKCTLTAGGVAKTDFGDAGNYEETKAAASDALKRAAVHFGIGRYLYEMSSCWVDLDEHGNITKASMATLDAKLKALVARVFGEQPQAAGGVDEATVLRSVLLDVMPDKESLIVQMDAASARKKIVAGLQKGMAAGKQSVAS